MRIIGLSGYTCLNTDKTAYINKDYNRKNPYFSAQYRSADCFVKGIYSVKDIINLFEKQASEVPLGLDLKVSPKTGKILGFSKMLDNGNKLNVIKTASDGSSQGLLYIILKEIKDDKPVKTIGIDMKTGAFLKLYNGKVHIMEGELETLDIDSAEYASANIKINKYIEQLSKHDNYQENATTVEVLKLKQKSKVEKLNLEDLYDEIEEMPDDKNFTKMIARDIEMGERERAKAKEIFDHDAEAEFNDYMIRENQPEYTHKPKLKKK